MNKGLTLYLNLLQRDRRNATINFHFKDPNSCIVKALQTLQKVAKDKQLRAQIDWNNQVYAVPEKLNEFKSQEN